MTRATSTAATGLVLPRPNGSSIRPRSRTLGPVRGRKKPSRKTVGRIVTTGAMKAFWAFDKVSVAAGAIPVKYKELIAVAVALTTQCPYCIDIHSANARKAGATDAEITEAAMVAAALRAGGAVTHATHALLTEAQNAN